MDRPIILRAAAAAVLALIALALLQRPPPVVHAQSLPCEAPNRGFDFDTYEVRDYVTGYAQAIRLAAAGHGYLAPYTIAGGEHVDFSYPGLESGPAASRSAPNPALAIPPSIYESIVWAESAWGNGSRSLVYGAVGPGLVSGDCGYGLGQVTTGMGQFGADSYAPGIPSARQALIGTDYLANLAEGARILADKWNSAPNYRPIAGNGDPSKLENWYFAIWSYNGFALKNHPLNPDLDPLRGGGSSVEAVFHCYDHSAPNYDALPSGQPTFGRNDFTYPEIVYGCMRYPPYIPGQTPATQQTAATTFEVGDSAIITGDPCTNLRPQPSTNGTPIACLATGSTVTIAGGPQTGSGYTWWQVSTADGKKGWVASDFLASSGTTVPTGPPTPNPPPLASATGRMWLPQRFSMPDFSVPAIASAFQLANFASCQSSLTVSACAAMSYPTEVPTAKPPITTHTDLTPAISPSLLNTLIGSPALSVAAPSAVSLAVSSSGVSSTATVTVSNTGTSIAPFRIRTSDPWLVVNHPGDPLDRTMDGGVAIGSEIQVLDLSPQSGSASTTQPGYQSVLQISLNPATMPAGGATATVTIEPLLGSGEVTVITVHATNAAASQAPLTHAHVIPQVADDGAS